MSSTAPSSTAPSSAPPSPSLESFGGSSASSPVDLTDPAAHTAGGEGLEAEGAKRHPIYYFDDGNLLIQIEGTLYNVHRYFFARDSSHFRALLERAGPGPLALDTTCADFDELLSILYPADFRRPAEKSTPQWAAVLHLAAAYGLASIRLLAIDHLAALAAAIDKIVLGRRYGVPAWLPAAYEAVCTRADPLSVQEGLRLGVEDVVKISAARQAYGYARARFEPAHLAQDLPAIFGLDTVHPGAPSVDPAEAEDAAIAALEAEVAEARAAFAALPAPPAVGALCMVYNDRFISNPAKRCHSCAACKPAEQDERRLRREDKEEKERRLEELVDATQRARREREEQERAGREARMALLRFWELVSC
ncbi:hypothetical protein HWV62_12164 [Athelia sp. TMB]|nr:hypothetical protein HWV62_12164 [Athelia sp. TMB]